MEHTHGTLISLWISANERVRYQHYVTWQRTAHHYVLIEIALFVVTFELNFEANKSE